MCLIKDITLYSIFGLIDIKHVHEECKPIEHRVFWVDFHYSCGFFSFHAFKLGNFFFTDEFANSKIVDKLIS